MILRGHDAGETGSKSMHSYISVYKGHDIASSSSSSTSSTVLEGCGSKTGSSRSNLDKASATTWTKT